jgi:hypothetical protein
MSERSERSLPARPKGMRENAMSERSERGLPARPKGMRENAMRAQR